MRKKTNTLYGYHDVDGGIATAICLRHLREQGANFYDFKIQSVLRPKQHKVCLSRFLRANYKELNISKKLIQDYDDFIDFAEIIHGNLYASEISMNDFNSTAIKLRSLFHTCAPLINKSALYKTLVNNIAQNSCVEDLFDSDMMFGKVLEYEHNITHLNATSKSKYLTTQA